MATRSPSPNPSRPKTPEISNSLRKSKEIPQRSSLSKPLTPNRASFEQKENEKEPNFSKPAKSRSPAISSLKGSKNFMAPTISAASKAIAASPRKKILQERNEVMNSVSNSLEFPIKEVGMTVEIQEIGSKSEMGFGSQEVLGSGELKKGESRIKNHQNVIFPSVSSLPIVDSLGAKPSIPPYDPKNNYLSPRPQFLHYRPNPRIEHYLNREEEFLVVSDGRQLEDSFSLESSEDDVAVLTEEKDSEGEPFPSEVEEVESVNETLVSEPETLVSEPEFKSEPLKRRPFRRSKLVPFLLVLVVACLYAPLSDSPIISSSILKDQCIPKVYTPPFGVFEDLQLRDYLAVANGNLHALASRFKNWSTDSIAYFTSVALLRKNDFGFYPVANMTTSAVDDTVSSDLGYKPETETEQPIKENLVEVSFTRHGLEVSAVAKEGDAEYNAEKAEIETLDEDTEMDDTENEDEKIEMVVSEDVKEDDIGAQRIEIEVSEGVIDANVVGYELEEIIEEDWRNDSEQEATHPSYEGPHTEEEVENTEMEYKQSPRDIVVEPEIIGDEEGCGDDNSIDHTESASSVDDHSEFGEEHQISHGLEPLKSMNYGTKLGLSLALLVLPATLAILYMKQKQAPMFEKEGQTTKKIGSVSGSSENYIHAKRSPSQYLRGNEGMIGDSGPSEVCSSWNNTSSSGRNQAKRGKEEQDLSNERRLRRDSSVSSSISYGSFTTYEKLSAKKGCKDEEVVTPVRRSSRIRNLVTSP